jgi:metallophosphoesterase (TIGR00282 family)
MRLLFLGDIVGSSGREIVLTHVQHLRKSLNLDCVIVNGENSAGGFGITESQVALFLQSGIDVITLGNHAFDQRNALVFIERIPSLIRPINYPAGTPGRGSFLLTTENGKRVLVVNAMGRLFMDAMDDPFAAVDRELKACPLGLGCDAIVVDFHAEATSEKQAMGFFCDGRATLVIGTHTHVPTADERILPQGTGYLSDVGMCGDYDSVIGMNKHEPVRRMVEKTPGARLEPAKGPGTLSGLVVCVAPETGLAESVHPLRLGPHLAHAFPQISP